MFTPRSIEDIQISFFRQLAENNSALTDISPGSILYTISRSIAGVHSEQDLIISDTAKGLFVSTATDSSLDELASNFSLVRKSGEFARGHALAITNEGNVSIQGGSVLTDVKTGVQFYINGTSLINLSSFIETKVGITAVKQGREYNLKAGSKLISNIYPTVIFIVGAHRTTSGEVCGDLKQGAEAESDTLFRQRVINFILNRRSTTQEAIKAALLSDSAVTWISFNNPLPGFLLIWVDSSYTLSTSELLRLEDIVNLVKPAGVVIEIKQAERQLVDMNLYALPNPQADLDELTKQLTGEIESYLLNLNLGLGLIRDDLIKKLKALPNLLQVDIITPEGNVNPVNNFTLLRSGNIWVTYDAA